jgi:hypothetical protein
LRFFYEIEERVSDGASIALGTHSNELGGGWQIVSLAVQSINEIFIVEWQIDVRSIGIILNDFVDGALGSHLGATKIQKHSGRVS